MKFLAQSKDGKLSLGSEFNAGRFRDHIRENPGMRYSIEPLLPESNDQRRFFEGAVIPLITFFQEGLDHRVESDRLKVREWLKLHFTPNEVIVAGVRHIVPGSTKGKLQRDKLVEMVLDWMEEQGYPTELLNPSDFKKWRDTVFPFGGPDNYIDYLVEMGRLKHKK